jgi:psp operon transcriptional activator
MLSRDDPDPIIGQADNFLVALERVSRVAPLTKPVLIIGERGTGKELIASRVHFLSERWQRPFIKFNCAALNEELLESELFGHVAGAYTGAVRGRVGRFELADGGTLFLDEIASMSLRLQEKLLRVVEYGEFEKLGTSETVRADVRLVGASNQDLPALAARGKFREDLLDRLSFDVVTVPPLRERKDDILLLAQKFAQDMARELKREYFAGFAPLAEKQMIEYGWPGNVRELRNVVERAVYRQESSKQPIERVEFDPFDSPYRPKTAPESIAGPGLAPAPAATLAPAEAIPEFPLDFVASSGQYEVRLIRAALANARFNQRKAAQRLSLTYHQFRGLLRKYKLLEEARGEI